LQGGCCLFADHVCRALCVDDGGIDDVGGEGADDEREGGIGLACSPEAVGVVAWVGGEEVDQRLDGRVDAWRWCVVAKSCEQPRELERGVVAEVGEGGVAGA
jgi:hypothetical protein